MTDGTACNDNNACTSADACTAGVCSGTSCASSICAADLGAFFGTNSTGWSFNGAATFSTASQTLVLVDGQNLIEAGSVVYKDAITVDSFLATFQFRFTTTNGRADGMMFVIETDGPNSIGGGYGGFGALGLHGYGVELDIFDSGPCDPGNGNHAGIDLFSACSTNSGIPSPIATSNDLFDSSMTNNGVGDIGDGTWRTAAIQLTNGQLSVSITGANNGTAVPVSNLQNVALPGFVSGTPYYFGLTAASGSNGQASKAEIQNLSIVFPTQRCL